MARVLRRAQPLLRRLLSVRSPSSASSALVRRFAYTLLKSPFHPSLFFSSNPQPRVSNRDESIFDSIQENMSSLVLSIWALLPVRGCRIGDKMSPRVWFGHGELGWGSQASSGSLFDGTLFWWLFFETGSSLLGLVPDTVVCALCSMCLQCRLVLVPSSSGL